MNEIKFKEGDVVVLKSSDWSMTIFSLGVMGEVASGELGYIEASDKAHTHAKCTWFNGITLEFKREVFNLAELKMD